jgi:nucleotide-binding universal stress UspA family protein
VLKDSTGRVLAYTDQLVEQTRCVATDYLKGVADRAGRQWPELIAQTDVAFGDPAVAIGDAASDVGAGLIVMATHGRTGAMRTVIGSVAGRVLEHGRTPLVLVHPTALHGR